MKMLRPLHPSQRLPLAFAAIAAVAVLIGLYFSHRLTDIVARSAEVNAEWIAYEAQLGRLAARATQVNEPGNDVFASRETEREAARLGIAKDAFAAELQALRTSQSPDAAWTRAADAELGRVDAAMSNLAAEAGALFDALRQGNPPEAGARMAAMDRAHTDAQTAIARLSETAHTRQQELFTDQINAAQQLRRIEAGLLVLTMLMLGAAWIYCRRTAQQLHAQAIEREARLAELASAHAALDTVREQLEHHVAERTAELQQGVERTRQILASAHDAFVAMDAEGIVRDWNSQAELTFGWSASDALGKPLHELIIPLPYRNAHLRGLQRFLSHGEGPVLNTRIELPALHRDGHEVPVELTISPVRQGDTHIFCAFMRDITARRRSQQQLRQLAAIVEGSDDAVMSKDVNSRFLSWNRAAEQLFGYPANEVIGQHVSLLVPAELLGEEATIMSRIRAGEPVQHYETVRIARNGEHIAVSLSVSPLHNAEGELAGASVIARDIRLRRRTDDALKQREASLSEAQRIARLGSWEWELATTNVTWSDEMYRIYGVTRDDFEPSSLSFLKLVHVDDRVRVSDELQGVVSAGVSTVYEFRIQRPDGTQRTVQTRARALLGPNGRPVRLVGTAQDISERKQFEDALDEARRVAVEASRAKSEFLASMSHEIRTPMNGVLGAVALLLDSELSSEQRELARVARSSGQGLLSLIDDILDVSKIEAGKLTLEPLPFDLLHLVEEVSAMIGTRAAGKSLEVITRYAADAPRHVVGDQGRVRQILGNLASNAVKFTERGHVLVEVTLEGLRDEGRAAELRIRVVDTGIGIAPDKLDTLFRKFSQADASTTRRYGGTGLGLAISKDLVGLMGGTIDAESQPGTGSIFGFTLTLPLQSHLETPEPTLGVMAGVRVLVVDDCAVHREVVLEQLASWGLDGEGCDSGAHALQRLRAAQAQGRPFQMAVIDYLMPELDGAMLGRAIKADAVLRETALVMLTSMGQRGHVAWLKDIGFSAYLVKPVRQSDLFGALQSVWNSCTAIGTNAGMRDMVTRHTLADARSTDTARRDKHPQFNARVLVAEDNPTNRLVATLMLRNLGCRVVVAGDGREALQLIDREDFDLVFMDCEMPEMDGFEATAAIRSRSDRRAGLPIIAVTAQAMQGDRNRCLRAGMNDYISKPVRPEAFAAALDRWALPAHREAGDSEWSLENSEPAPSSDAFLPAALDAAVVERLHALERATEPGLVQQIFDSFVSEGGQQIGGLRRLALRAESEAIRRAAHLLKGASATVGADGLAELAGELQRKALDCPATDSLELIDRLDAEFKRVVACMVVQAEATTTDVETSV